MPITLPTECWPYVKPKSDWSGRKQFMLEYILPVYKTVHRGGELWHYLCKCECGKEKIIYARPNVKSCGCHKSKISKINIDRCNALMRERRLSPPAAPTVKTVMKPFNKATCCVRDSVGCKHYRPCQNERLNGKKVSDRYIEGGLCYEI